MKNQSIIVLLLVLFGWQAIALSQITEAEYFFDLDPGVGNGNSIAVTSGNTLDDTFLIATDGLASGLHVLHIRVKGTNAIWSLFNRDYIYVHEVNTSVAKPIVEAEFFFDTDPGVGSATALSVTNDFTIDETFSIPVPEILTDGDHFIHIRAKDMDGNWSLYRWALLQVDSTLSADEFAEDIVTIFPNPATDYIHIQSRYEIDSIVFYDMLGRTFIKTRSENSNVDVSNLQAGIYVLHIASDRRHVKKKVIID